MCLHAFKIKQQRQEEEEEEEIEIARNPWKLKRAHNGGEKKQSEMSSAQSTKLRQKQRQWTAVTTSK